ncbi:hypothetical protein LX81_03816 [Palleronia aestuarii]|uniref:Uncharacterized protein n=1 Tax=Palleronia aestuarii TaxID=568105 RepID=A0A2W7N091_9RHOB|nr:hypothetical protein LX81_03816 [Palleronia aestuarii]
MTGSRRTGADRAALRPICPARSCRASGNHALAGIRARITRNEYAADIPHLNEGNAP